MSRSIFLILIFLASCRGTEKKQVDNFIDSSSLSLKGHEDEISFLTSDMSVHDFLKAVKIDDSSDFNSITIKQEFKKDWINEKDLDSLITLIDSREKCKCILNPLSSTIPIGDSADVGGYVILILNSYRHKSTLQFKTWACPKTNKDDVIEITRWKKELKQSRFR